VPQDFASLSTHEEARWDSPSNTDHDFTIWKFYGGRYSCLQHGLIGKKSLCQVCVDKPNEKPDKSPQRKTHYCIGRSPVGNFINDDLVDFISRYRYHLFLVIVLGKNWCIKFRLDNYHRVEGSVLIVRDYADKLNYELNGQSKSQGMSNRKAVGMEGITARFYDNGEPVMEFYSYLSSEKTQNAKTSYMHTRLMIVNLQQRGYLERFTGATLFKQSDGCSAQYTSGTAIFCSIMIANRYGIMVNKMITCPQHGKGTVDAISGGDKHYAQRHFLTANLAGGELDNYTIGFDDKEVDPAAEIARILSAPSHVSGLEGYVQSKKKHGQATIRERHYQVIDWREMNMPIPKTTFTVKDGFPKHYYPPDPNANPEDAQKIKKKVRPYGGVSDHFQVYAHWKIPVHYAKSRAALVVC
jgi:hypothetical protein